MAIKKVWIEEGCIACNLCMDLAPEVFLVKGNESCVIQPDASRHFEAKREAIEQAAQDCPVEVIKVEE